MPWSPLSVRDYLASVLGGLALGALLSAGAILAASLG